MSGNKMFEGLSGNTAQAPRRSGGGGGGGSSKRSERQTEAVRTMQLVMGKLQVALGTTTGAKKAATTLNVKDLDDKAIMKHAGGFGGTSAGGNSGSYDGIWGRNTKKALGRIVAFIDAANISGVLIQEGKGASPTKEMEDAAIIKAAEDNITNLGRLFTRVGASAPSEIGSRSGPGFQFDMIPSELINVLPDTPDPWPTQRGGVSVTAGEIGNIIQFVNFIQNLTYTTCEKLPEIKEEKTASDAAAMILEGTLYSFADPADTNTDGVSAAHGGAAGGASVGAASAAAVVRNSEETEVEVTDKKESKPSGTGPCFSSVGHFIDWFKKRSFWVHNQLAVALQNATPYPVRKDGEKQRSTVRADVDNARKYQQTIEHVSQQWDKAKDHVEDIIRDDGNENNPRVTRPILIRALREGGLIGNQAARPNRGRGGRRRSGDGRTLSRDGGDAIFLKGPIQDQMDLYRVQDTFSGDGAALSHLQRLSKNGQLPYLNRSNWRGSNWISISETLNKPTEVERLRAFPEFARALSAYLQSLFDTWRTDRDILPVDIASQSRKLRIWKRDIRSQKDVARSNMSYAVSDAQKGETNAE